MLVHTYRSEPPTINFAPFELDAILYQVPDPADPGPPRIVQLKPESALVQMYPPHTQAANRTPSELEVMPDQL